MRNSMNYAAYTHLDQKHTRAERAKELIEKFGWQCNIYDWDDLPASFNDDLIITKARSPRFWLIHPDPARITESVYLGAYRKLRKHVVNRAAAEMTHMKEQILKSTTVDPTSKSSIINPNRATIWLERGIEISGDMINSQFANNPKLNFQVLKADRRFWATSREHWNEIIRETKVDKVRYIAERSDCDNFAIAFAGIAALKYGINTAGIVFDESGGHAYNIICVIDEHKQITLELFEPQTDRIVTKKLGTKPYTGQKGYVLFA